jgi:hypothetical protein
VASVTGNVGGNVVGSVGSVSAAITLPSIPTNWLTAAGLASDAVIEIQTGLSTLTDTGVRSAIGMAAADLDSQLAAIIVAIGSGGLDAAGVRSALGMTTANLDTQLSGIATSASAGTAKQGVAFPGFEFMMTDNVNHTPAIGMTVSCTRSVDRGAFAAGTLANITEVGFGMYSVDFGSGDMGGKVITLRATAPGCDDTFITILTSP